MDQKDKIILQQLDVIRSMTENGIKRMNSDFWGAPAAPQTPSAPKAPSGGESEKKAAVSTGQKEAEPKEELPPPEKMEDLLSELDSYIGLDVVKDEVHSLINMVQVYKLRREHDLPTTDMSLHMVFTGNPGTGKTMMARMMARIYRSLGILSKGQLIEVDRSGLVAGYVGQTAIKTAEVVQKALGGVLFIDEAYALTSRGGTDYGQEAVDTLLKAMEDHREDLVVIVAGYTELMEAFVKSNPGLESRFNRFIHFPDYTVQEMLDIFEMRCRKSGYELDGDARELLKSLLALCSLDVEGFGNARGVRNLFERAVSAQADRLARQANVTREQLMLLTADDIRVAGGGCEDGEPPAAEKTDAAKKE